MRILFATLLLAGLATTLAQVAPALAQTCADQHNACRSRGHKEAECRKSTNACLKSGRWIGPAGNEYPVSKKK